MRTSALMSEGRTVPGAQEALAKYQQTRGGGGRQREREDSSCAWLLPGPSPPDTRGPLVKAVWSLSEDALRRSDETVQVSQNHASVLELRGVRGR